MSLPDLPEFPPTIELLPHDAPMMLIESVLSHTPTRTECIIDVDSSSLFVEPDGSVPAWLSLEYMAQSIAAHGGLVDRAASRPTRPGLLLGSRNLCINIEKFAAHQRLRVEVCHRRGDIGMMAFECSLFDVTDADTVLAGGTLNVYLLESFDALVREFDHANQQR
jgi:predicted hotdog family 3-hydroxylacyl-ACP dehydratase